MDGHADDTILPHLISRTGGVKQGINVGRFGVRLVDQIVFRQGNEIRVGLSEREIYELVAVNENVLKVRHIRVRS